MAIRNIRVWALAGLFSLALHCASAQIAVNRRVARPATAVSLTLSVSPTSVTFRLLPKGTAVASSQITITATLGSGGCSGFCQINLYGHFNSAATALSGGSPIVNIPSSEVLGQTPTGSATSYTAFTQSGPYGGAGASLLLTSQPLIFTPGGFGEAIPLNLEVNLANQPQLPAGSYTGTLYIEAQSF